MYNVGVFPGKFVPPHRGHLNGILQAGTKCRKLYVVVSHDSNLDTELFKNSPIKQPTMQQKARWLSIELADLEHIKVVMLDETNIPLYPHGWKEWAKLLNQAVPEPFDVIFGGEPQYAEEGYTKYFPHVKYELYDTERTEYPISATRIRTNPFEHWDYILGAARPYVAKKVLLVGTESCGKTTLTKMLAKTFYTSWAQEEGRYYSARHMGGNEDVFTIEDFYNICWEQRQVEEHALKGANKIVFFDTDSVITQYYCKMYLGEYNPKIENLIDPTRYDLVMMMKPDVAWVADGLRWLDGDERRWQLHQELKQMYIDRGFANIIEVGGNYTERFNEAVKISKGLIQQS